MQKTIELKPDLIGQILLKEGFKKWFLYMFRVIEGHKFVLEDLHNNLFDVFDKIYNQELLRLILNLPPRSAKTTLIKYFIVYAITQNPKSNFIYTSYSQDLVSQISQHIKNILENPVYKAMYPSNIEYQEDLTDLVDDFWKEYLFNENKKTTYTNKKIITNQGGEILFASIGAQITGFGAGARISNKFSGFLAIDDANKPSDIRSELLREKTKIYFEETLLSRLNNSNIPVINIQQRLHLDDMSGFLLNKYKFNIVKIPLIKEDGTCNLPSQYTTERIEELRQNPSMFSAQYQQEPVEDGGNLFKIDWFKFTDEIPDENSFDYRFITADIAYKDKEQNDFTVFGYWGVKKVDNIKKLYLIDMQRAKMQAVDIERWIDNWIKIKQTYKFRNIWIEDKAHGIYLNQAFRNKRYNIPTEEQIKETLPRERDKVERANNILPYIDRIVSNIHINSKIDCIEDFKKEVLAFPNGKHDDIVDCTVDAIKIAFAGNDIVEMYKNIYEY